MGGYCQLTEKYCVSLDKHHIIPVEYGGKDGPTILLNPEIHQILHRCINNPVMKSSFLESLPPPQQVKAVALLKAVYYAKTMEKEGNLLSILNT